MPLRQQKNKFVKRCVNCGEDLTRTNQFGDVVQAEQGGATNLKNKKCPYCGQSTEIPTPATLKREDAEREAAQKKHPLPQEKTPQQVEEEYKKWKMSQGMPVKEPTVATTPKQEVVKPIQTAPVTDLRHPKKKAKFKPQPGQTAFNFAEEKKAIGSSQTKKGTKSYDETKDDSLTGNIKGIIGGAGNVLRGGAQVARNRKDVIPALKQTGTGKLMSSAWNKFKGIGSKAAPAAGATKPTTPVTPPVAQSGRTNSQLDNSSMIANKPASVGPNASFSTGVNVPTGVKVPMKDVPRKPTNATASKGFNAQTPPFVKAVEEKDKYFGDPNEQESKIPGLVNRAKGKDKNPNFKSGPIRELTKTEIDEVLNSNLKPDWERYEGKREHGERGKPDYEQIQRREKDRQNLKRNLAVPERPTDREYALSVGNPLRDVQGKPHFKQKTERGKIGEDERIKREMDTMREAANLKPKTYAKRMYGEPTEELPETESPPPIYYKRTEPKTGKS
jgi:hypothetical protein